MLQHAAAGPAQHTEAVRIIEHEPRIVALAQLQQIGHPRDVAVHAEHRVGRDQLAARLGCREQLVERGEIAVRIAFEVGARQQHRVIERRMIEFVGEHRIVAPGERGHDADVCHVAGRKQQRARQAYKLRQRFLERMVRSHVAEDQVRCTGADAVARRTLTRRRRQPRVAREAKVVVAAKRHDLASVNHHACTLRAFERVAVARKSLRLDASQFVGEACGEC